MKIKYKKLDLKFVKKNYPILYDTLYDISKGQLENPAYQTIAQSVAGLCLEIALKSDGTPELFEDDFPIELLGEKEEDY